MMIAGLCLLILLARPVGGDRRPFSFAPLMGDPPTLHVADPAIVGAEVTVNGGDSARPTTPFTFNWGDGSSTRSFFPAKHTYADTSRSYTVTVTAHYGSRTANQSVRVAFVKPSFACRRDPSVPRRVRIASAPVALATTMSGYRPPIRLQGFDDAGLAIPRDALEYALDVGHMIQMDLCNGDVDRQGGLDQVVLNQPAFGGAFSLWFTRPVAMGANPAYLSSLSGLSSLYHEMGHNITLNSPARYRFGGKTDGPMNTIVSETLAQIMQHATAWLILNHPRHYGLSDGLAEGLERSAQAAFAGMARAHRDYVAQGCPFATRQEPGSKQDRTFGTFMTVACVFVQEAERAGDMRGATKRLMRMLQTFNEEDHRRYQVPENDAFRATFLVAAVSHGLGRDMRPKFRELRFPIDAAVYDEMTTRPNVIGSEAKP
jgi:hypothetical protein